MCLIFRAKSERLKTISRKYASEASRGSGNF
jgi:hypothetical protein